MGSLSEEVRTEVLCGHICNLEAENAKLRERIHELEMEGSDHFYRTAYAEDANRTLEAENVKLRELIKDLKCAPCCGDACWMKLTDRMREFGIEVSE